MNKIHMRNQKRREMVEAIVNWQEPIHEVARIFDVPQRTIFGWRLVSRRGLGRAEREEALGASAKADGAQIRWVSDSITPGNPQQFQFAYGLWTRKILRDLLGSRLKVQLSTSSLRPLLCRLVLSSQQPLYQAYCKDPEHANACPTATFPEAVVRAKDIERPAVLRR